MKKSQSGFTLIELVVVIVLLGILGVTALGKFQDLSGDASVAAVNGVATELTGAAAINYAKSLTGTPSVTIGQGATGVDTAATSENCDGANTALGLLFTGNNLPTGYTLTSDTAAACAGGAGDIYTCEVSDGTNTADATIVCTQ